MARLPTDTTSDLGDSGGVIPASPLLPEEDAIGDPDDGDSQDDTLPADLWY